MGKIISGNASFDESRNLTGESIPVYKKTGDNIFSGTVILRALRILLRL